MSIPVIDLSEFSSHDPDLKIAFVEKLGKAYEDVGFVAVRNHGIPNDLINHLYNCIKKFFSLPLKMKLRYEIPGLAGQRGYTSFGREHAKGSSNADLKEFFQYGQNVEDDHPVKSEYPENVKVNEVEGFNETVYQAYKYFEKSGTAILQAIALYLGLDKKYFDNYIHNGNSILRCIHYPPITREPESAIRAEQHEDINLITLLVGASADGLEILSNKKSGNLLFHYLIR
ncbi:MAG: 2-oxoglutarate and iron-dependent oxygenase domain-containing protein [Segetibacter sp.]